MIGLPKTFPGAKFWGTGSRDYKKYAKKWTGMLLYKSEMTNLCCSSCVVCLFACVLFTSRMNDLSHSGCFVLLNAAPFELNHFSSKFQRWWSESERQASSEHICSVVLISVLWIILLHHLVLTFLFFFYTDDPFLTSCKTKQPVGRI